ncbi:HNH endonuclease signature motif containing protein [Cellulosimicrobium sp. Marseille-Q4280]|uniref:HNH endonuclease n=1 Tax=Cellulosimicrobium sp. Marseille-Q4280 TaxID=2937992 RepID=UPI002040E7D2|nr:HNH endonuclease signature motif containing protein [Cellulosimicrobium sp. Marseille-Q4280]
MTTTRELVRDERTGLWLLPANPRVPRALTLDGQMDQTTYDALVVGCRRKVGLFRYTSMADVYDADDFAPDELDAVVLAVGAEDDEDRLIGTALDGRRLGTIWWHHLHLVQAFAEFDVGQLGVRAWVRSPGGWFDDIMVSLAEPETVHAAVATFAAERGMRLLAPPRASRLSGPLRPPFTASKQTPAPVFTDVRRFERLDVSDLVAMTAPGGPDVLPRAELAHPVVGEVLERDGELTEYVPLTEFAWQETSSRDGIASALATGWDVHVARHRRTGVWAAIALDSTGASGAVDGHVHEADDVRWMRRGWGNGRNVQVEFEVDGTTWYFGVEHVRDVDEEGASWTWSAHSFGSTWGGHRKGARYAELERARARAVRASASFRRRAIAFGIEPRDVVLFDPWSVFERDDWVCGICGGEVDRELEWPSEGCATLDHRVPIARGGQHTPENTQLAHWRCNLAKGDRPAAS